MLFYVIEVWEQLTAQLGYNYAEQAKQRDELIWSKGASSHVPCKSCVPTNTQTCCIVA